MRSFLPLTLVLLAGCPDRTISEVNPEQGRVEYKDIPISVNRKIDILFVIDNSASMADKQNNLANNFPDFINVLETIPGGLPDVHIGVVTSDMGTSATQDGVGPAVGGACAGTGDNGALQTSGATLSGGLAFIKDVRDPAGTGRDRNYTGSLADVFSTMAKVGDEGCGFEQHLESMRRALNNNPQNGGFLRSDAYLAVIFIADEDDCSMSKKALLGPASAAMGSLQSFRCARFGVTCDVNGATPDAMTQVGSKAQCHPNESSQYLEGVRTYVDFLKGLKPGKEDMVVVAGIMGTPEPVQVELREVTPGSGVEPALRHSCDYTNSAMKKEVADPPIRLKFFLDQFPNRSTYTSICGSNLSPALQQIAELLRSILPDPCIRGTLADVDPVTPGAQYDCSVSDVVDPYGPGRSETVLPACELSSAKPCWRIAEDAENCTDAPHLKLQIDRVGLPPDNTHIIASCVTEAI